MSPYSGRGAYSTAISALPSRQVTRRSRTWGLSAPSSCPRSLRPTANPSTRLSVPVAVRNFVSRTIVGPRYERLVSSTPRGWIEKCPPSWSRRRAKVEGLSKGGKHSQSIEPALLTSAAV